jgi:hypothetical protein
MFTKTAFALAIVLGTAFGAFAATNRPSVAPKQDVYDARGKYVGSDSDAGVRFNLRRDAHQGAY